MQKSFLTHNPVSYLASSLPQHLYDNMPVKDDHNDTSIGFYRANPIEMKIPHASSVIVLLMSCLLLNTIKKKQSR